MTADPLGRHVELDRLIAAAHRRGDAEAERKLRIEKQSLDYGLDQRITADVDVAALMESVRVDIARRGSSALVALFESVSGSDPAPNLYWQRAPQAR